MAAKWGRISGQSGRAKAAGFQRLEMLEIFFGVVVEIVGILVLNLRHYDYLKPLPELGFFGFLGNLGIGNL